MTIPFSYEELNRFDSFDDKVQYCESHLTNVGNGSSRAVFKLDDKKVLKVAKDEKGVAQNKHEATAVSLSIFAKVFNVADDHSWIEMEAATIPTKEDINRVFGIDYEDFCSIVSYMTNKCGISEVLGGSSDREFLEKYDVFQTPYETESGMTEACWTYLGGMWLWLCTKPSFVEYWESIQLDNLGIVMRGGVETIVIVDFGVNKAIYDKFYRGGGKRENAVELD